MLSTLSVHALRATASTTTSATTTTSAALLAATTTTPTTTPTTTTTTPLMPRRSLAKKSKIGGRLSATEQKRIEELLTEKEQKKLPPTIKKIVDADNESKKDVKLKEKAEKRELIYRRLGLERDARIAFLKERYAQAYTPPVDDALKRRMYALHASAPERWTSKRLALKFGFREDRVRCWLEWKRDEAAELARGTLLPDTLERLFAGEFGTLAPGAEREQLSVRRSKATSYDYQTMDDDVDDSLLLEAARPLASQQLPALPRDRRAAPPGYDPAAHLDDDDVAAAAAAAGEVDAETGEERLPAATTALASGLPERARPVVFLDITDYRDDDAVAEHERAAWVLTRRGTVRTVTYDERRRMLSAWFSHREQRHKWRARHALRIGTLYAPERGEDDEAKRVWREAGV